MAANGSGGNLKYLIGGLLLLAGAVGLWLMLQQPPATATITPPPAAQKSPDRVNPLDTDLILEEEPDAGQPIAPAVAEPDKPKKPARDARSEWDCEGDVARAALQSVINSNRAQIRNCYERRLKVNNVLQGDLTLKLKIGGNGQMAATQVTGSLRDNEVFSCVRQIAQKWTFPPPAGGNCAVVQVPFQFSPKQ